MSAPETGKLLDNVEVKTRSKDHYSSAGIGGKPCRIHRVTWADLAMLGVVLTGMTVALVAIFYKPTAMYFGQKYQLVVLGFVLSIMASCSARQIQKLSLVYEARAGRSTLQNFDALLRSDYFSRAVSLGPRLILLFLFCLPLGLSVAYKNFIGGSTNLAIPSTSGHFGFTAAPGYQLMGNGLSLLVNVYLPFWSQQAIGRTYGFNLYVVDNQTAAVLDAPLPQYITVLQGALSNSESMNVTVEVNATVTQNINPSASERNDQSYWDAKRDLFQERRRSSNNFVNTTEEMWAGSGPSSLNNYTEIFLSIANATQNQTFQSQAERFVSTRQTCRGTWNITNANITLVNVENLQLTNESQSTDQATIQSNSLEINTWFFHFISEYDWETRGHWDQPLPGANNENSPSRFRPAVNTRPALVASMLWARITSLQGPERPRHHNYTTSYWKESNDIVKMKSAVTLQRSSWLIVIVVINPVLTILAVLGKALLHTTPIGDNFGVISLLAGVKGDVSKTLQGAALSGKLSRDIRVTFNARNHHGFWYERLELDLGSQGESSKLCPKTLYG